MKYYGHMQREEFEQLVAQGYDLLPEWVKKKIKNVAVLVEDEPSMEVRQREGLGPHETLLGYYHGVPLSERGDLYGVGGAVLPDTITIFQKPILDAAKEEAFPLVVSGVDPGASEDIYKECVRKIVADTVWHEFAHHFGMDEYEVRMRENERGI